MTSLSSAPFRRRFAAAGAVLGLVAASVVGGVALSASAAPEAPVLLDSSGQVIVPGSTISANSTTVTIHGTGAPGATVVPTIDDDDNYNATVDDEGNWSADVETYSDGTHDLDVYQTDGETTSPTITFTIYVEIPPSAPTIGLSDAGDDITSESAVDVEGTLLQSGSVESITVTVSLNGGPESPYCSDDGGEGSLGSEWNCYAWDSSELGIGTNVLRAYAISSSGVSSVASASLTVIRISDPVITNPQTSYTNSTNLTFSGSFADYAMFPGGFHYTFRALLGDEFSTVVCEGDATTADFGCSADVPANIYSLHLEIDTEDGHYFESDEQNLTLDTDAPAPPAITGPGALGPSQMLEYSGTLTSISGTGEPDATVTLLADGSPVACSNAPVIAELGDGYYSEEGYWTCILASPATPGTHTYSAFQTDQARNDSDTSSASDSLRATIPVPPPGVLGGQNRSVQQGGTFTLGGTKTPDASVVVTLLVPGGPNVQFAACNQIVNGDKAAWQCDYSTRGLNLDPGTYRLSIVQVYDGVASPELAPRPTLTVTALPAVVAPTPTPTPTATKPPLTWTLVMTGVSGALKPGQWVGLSSSGLPAGSEISAELHSTPIALGSTTVRSDGTFNFRVQIPMNVEPGDHHIVVTLTAPGEDPSIVQSAVQIELDGKATPPRDEEDIHAAFAVPGGAVIDRNNPDSPTAITGSIPTAFDILTSPGTIGIAAGLALVILLLVALPTEILNATIESNTSRFGRVFAAIQSAIDRATEWFIRVTRTPLIASVILLVVTSFIFGFVDPGFGFDLASVRLVLSLALALFVITFVASSLTGRLIRKRWSLESEIGMQPAALIFALLGVLVARLLDFSPGFLVGLVIGLELAHRATEHQRVRAIVVEFSFIVGFGVLAWLAYSAWVGLQGDAELGFVGGLVQDALVAITSEGLTAVTVAMIPIAFLDGKTIFESSKKLWVLMFLVVATAFSLLVLPTALAGQEITNIVTWVAVLIGFAVVTLGLTVWLRRTGRSVSAEANEKVSA